MTRTAVRGEFVGRADELERISALRAEAAGGVPTAVLIGGDAGIGKTRLVGEVVNAARGDGFRALFGQCVYLGGETMPYAPIVEILRELAIAGGGTSAPLMMSGQMELLRLAPDLDPERMAPDGDPNPLRLFEQLLALVRRLSADRPVLLVIEDLHWADDSTRALLAFLLRHLRAGPVMVVGTYRSDELHRRHPLRRWLSELDRGVHPERVELRPFGRPELRRMLEALAGRPVAPDTVMRIHSRSGGNAFYAEHLFAHTYGHAEATSLEEAVRGRLTDLTDETWSLLIRAASFRRIDPTMLAALTRRPEDEVDAALRHLIDRGVLVNAGDELRFGHELVREVLYDSLLPGERVRIHRQIAEALEQVSDPGAAAGELAHHWSAAGVPERALPASVRAIDEAMRLSAVAEACTHCERALELWEQVVDPERVTDISRRDLLHAYADAAYLNGTPQAAIPLVRRELAQIRPGYPALVPLYERLVTCARAAQDAEALAVAERAAEHIGEFAEPSVRARLLKVTASAALVMGRMDFVEEVTGAGLAAAREAGDDIAELAISIARGYALGLQGRAEGLDTLVGLVEHARSTGDRDGWHRALTSYAFCMCVAGRPDETLILCDEGIRQFGQSMSLRAEFRTYRMGALRWLGRWDDVMAEAEALAFDLEMLGWDDLLGAALAPVLVERGDLGRAQPMVNAAWLKIRRTPLHALAVPSTVGAAAMAAIYAGCPADAHQYVVRGLASCWSVRVPELVAVGVRAAAEEIADARLAHDERAAAEALGRAESLLSHLDSAVGDARVDIPYCQEVMRAWSTQARAELGRAQQQAEPDVWMSLADKWPALYRPEQGAYCHYRAAEARLRTRRSDRHAAAAALAAAKQAASRLGARPLLVAIDALATQSRLVFPPAPMAVPASMDPFGLTAREHDVLALVAKGLTNRQIGEALFISGKTVSTHVSRILGKLGVDSRGTAAEAYHRLGLADDRAERT
jgi:ATP/maltotriose-dependent transcriptional regulator MalT